MWSHSILLAGYIAAGFATPISMPQACFVYGEIFYSPAQTTAMLSSNCAIHIERHDQLIVMKGSSGRFNVIIPNDPGVHELVYRWGQTVARFDDTKVEVTAGPLMERTVVEQKSGAGY
jgi:hypothetical protein